MQEGASGNQVMSPLVVHPRDVTFMQGHRCVAAVRYVINTSECLIGGW
jgi:hypothetical protein